MKGKANGTSFIYTVFGLGLDMLLERKVCNVYREALFWTPEGKRQ